MVDTIPLYKAIAEMRRLTLAKQTFSFAHSTLDRSRMAGSKGLCYVKNASLRRAARQESIVDAQFKLFYYDHDIDEPRNCWQPLIMFFNEKKVELL